MKKILFVTGNLTYGGAPKILISVANYLSINNNVEIYNFGYSENFYPIEGNVKFQNIVLKRPKNLSEKLVLAVVRFCKIQKKILVEKPDVVIAFDNTEKLFIVLASMFVKTKSIVCERKDPYNYKKNKKNTMYWRYNHADACIFQTEGARNYFSSKVKEHSRVIPNFVNAVDVKIDTWETRKKEIAFVGRFDVEAKRQDLMVEAFKIIHNKYPDYKLVFYGGENGVGEDSTMIHRMVEEYGLQAFVQFAGVVRPTTEYISNARIFVITSDYEGIPNALLEAMACGLPVISTDCSPGGARELLEDKQTGILVPRDDAKAIADAIDFYCQNPDIADKYGKNAKESVKVLSPSDILPKWEAYIEEVTK